MYKKILSLTLAILMVCSCVMVSASAESLTDEEALMQTLKEAYIEKWKADYKDTFDFEWFNGKLSYFGYLGEAGCHVFQAAAVPGEPVAPTDEIGDYLFTAYMCMGYCDTNPAGMYAYKDGELYTLREAYEKGLVDLDLLYEKVSDNYTMSPLSDEEILENKCKAEFIEEYNIATEDENEVHIVGAVKYPNYTVFVARYELPFDGKDPERDFYVDGYWFYEGTVADYYTLDNYGNVEKLEETANKGFIDLDEIYSTFSKVGEMHLRGDIDGDKSLTIKDATLIQKYLAKYPEAVETVWTHPINFRVADADLSGLYIESINDDSEITIKDATYIQKKVAKIIVEDERPRFSYDHIIVSFDTKDVREYTLEDFPEYEFERIERWEALSFDCVTLTLYLKNPGKENVIDAVNSLKYREGSEFWTVHEDGLMYPD